MLLALRSLFEDGGGGSDRKDMLVKPRGIAVASAETMLTSASDEDELLIALLLGGLR